MKPYIVQGILEARPGKEEGLAEILSALVSASLEEEGCIEYKLHRCIDHPARFMFYEIWLDQAAFLKHTETKHIKAWHAIKAEFLIAPNEVSFWQVLNTVD